MTDLPTWRDAVIEGGSVNNVNGSILIAPTASDQNAIVVKAPDAAWGDPATVPYGKGQAFLLLKDGKVGDPGIAVLDDLVIARINRAGGAGFAGGLHLATGLRRRPGDTPATQSLWVGPTDDCIGIIVDAANLTPAFAYQQWRLSDATVLAEITKDGVLFCNRGARIASSGAAVNATITLARGAANTEMQVGVSGGANLMLTGSVAGDSIVKAISGAGGTGKLMIGAGTSPIIAWTSTTLGFYGVAPIVRQAAAADATDLATAITLVNGLKAQLKTLGLLS